MIPSELNPAQRLLRFCITFVPYHYRWAVFTRVKHLFPSIPFVDRTSRGVAYVCDLKEAHLKQLFTKRAHEPEVFDILRPFVIGRQFVDIGANIGYFSLNFSPLASQVLAIEPNPNALAYLRTNISLNSRKNIIVYPYALSNVRGQANLLSTSGATDSSTFIPEVNKDLTTAVETRKPEDLFDEYAIDGAVVKMDVQGFEVVLIPEFAPLFPRIDTMLVSFHFPPIKAGFSPREIQQMLHSLSYFPIVRNMRNENLGPQWQKDLNWDATSDQTYIFQRPSKLADN